MLRHAPRTLPALAAAGLPYGGVSRASTAMVESKMDMLVRTLLHMWAAAFAPLWSPLGLLGTPTVCLAVIVLCDPVFRPWGPNCSNCSNCSNCPNCPLCSARGGPCRALLTGRQCCAHGCVHPPRCWGAGEG